MLRRKYRLAIESLEPRRLLSGQPWLEFEDSGQDLGANSFGVALGDLDGDDDLDAFLGCYNGFGSSGHCSENMVMLNDGQGNMTQGWSERTSVVEAVALGDVDGDGDLDAFLALGTPASPSANQVFLNDGAGNFSDTGQRLGRGISFQVALGDVDDDGDLDAFVANVGGFSGSGARSKLWLNDGQGTFTDSGQDLDNQFVFAVALGDLDGDGDLDAFLGKGGTDKVYLNDGHGNFSNSGQTLGRGQANGVQLGDLDGDSDLDAFVVNGTFGGNGNPNEVWMNDGLGNFTDSGQNLGRSLSRWVELADADRDGDLDAFVANGPGPAKQENKVWLNDGAGGFGESGIDLGGRRDQSVGLAVGDLDGDQDLDVIVGNLDASNELLLNRLFSPGDANRDGQFDQKDIVAVLQAGKYNTGQLATWGEGDWNADEVFDQFDIVAALQTGTYLRNL